MKKKSRIILSFILVFSLLILSTACGKSAGTAEPGTEEASTGAVSGESAEKDKKVAGSLLLAMACSRSALKSVVLCHASSYMPSELFVT